LPHDILCGYDTMIVGLEKLRDLMVHETDPTAEVMYIK
jgi:hypothetical protein